MCDVLVRISAQAARKLGGFPQNSAPVRQQAFDNNKICYFGIADL
jgi:hypothetical protein